MNDKQLTKRINDIIKYVDDPNYIEKPDEDAVNAAYEQTLALYLIVQELRLLNKKTNFNLG